MRDSACGTSVAMSAPLKVTRPGLGTDEAEQDLDHGRFAGAGRAGEHQDLAGGHAEAQAVQRRAAGGVPGQAHVLEGDGDAARLDGAHGERRAAGAGIGRQGGERLGGAGGVERSW